jgi:CheY-like chemotaxis protein
MTTSPGSGLAREEFARWVHDALNELYDSLSLRTHPLADALRLAPGDPLQRGQTLRREILEAIRTLRPAAGVPARSPDWRVYRILELRYIEGLTPDEVIERVALSRSHYFHEQGRALDALVAALWDKYLTVHQADAVAPPLDQATHEDLVRSESERLYTSPDTQELVPVAALLKDLQPVLEQVATVHGVSLRLEMGHPGMVLPANRVLLRQAILEAVACLLNRAGVDVLQVATFEDLPHMGIDFTARLSTTADASSPASPAGHGAMDTCRQLMATMAGHIEVADAPDAARARFIWLSPGPRRLLVIDDNEGFEDLFRRYLVGRDWEVIGARNGAQARELIPQVHPTVIMLDVLMPQEDGWELLMALQRDQATRAIPIIVCSVINQPQVAIALGAAACLPKPVRPQALLRVLAPWSPPPTVPTINENDRS